MAVTESVELRGHIIDSGDALPPAGRRARLRRRLPHRAPRRRRGHEDESYARVVVTAADEADARPARDAAAGARRQPGRPRRGGRCARSRPDGVFPEDFYSTTNLDTVGPAGRPLGAGGAARRWTAAWSSPATPGTRACAPCRSATSRAGDAVVCGVARRAGAVPPQASRATRRRLRVHELGRLQREAAGAAGPPDRRADARGEGRRAAGPVGRRPGGRAHRRGAGDGRALVEAGYVDVLFAGNALATHDIESALFGTSLGVDLAKGSGVDARPRAPHPGHQPIRARRLDRRGRRVRAC